MNELEKQSILKAQCLRRDRNRCVITDLYDYDKFWKLEKKQQAGIRDSRTECAHIIPYSAAPAWTDHGVDLEDVSTPIAFCGQKLNMKTGSRKVKNMGAPV